ncbi:hypothetical protein, partial [Bradyrhizobium sp. 35]|uniref:hypothetical protein n=1 Tax=Bradyrhizobium sp. 35 TaxID=2782670 RepID=UPI001FF7AE06
LLRCRLVAPATVPTNKPDPQFLIIVCHHKVSTYFGGHLMHQSTQKQKVQGNSRLRCINCWDGAGEGNRTLVFSLEVSKYCSVFKGYSDIFGVF